MLVDGIDQHGDVFGRGELGDAMAEVEDMPGVGAIGVENLLRFGGNSLGAAKQHCGIQIALQGNPITHLTAGGTDIHGPVEADRVGAAVGDVGQPQAAALGEDDARDLLAVLLTPFSGDGQHAVVQLDFDILLLHARHFKAGEVVVFVFMHIHGQLVTGHARENFAEVVDEAAQLVRKERAQEENINKLALMLGALCHDLGKPLCTQLKDGRMRSIGHDVLGEAPTRSFLDRLTNNTKLIDAVVKLVLEHLRPVQLYHLRHKVSEGAIKRLALRVDMEDLLLVAKADFLGRTTEEAKKRRFFAGQWLRKTLLKLNVAKKTLIPWLRGKDLLAMGLAPGPIYAKIIDESFELQLEGELKSPADALSWAKKRIAAEL